MRKGAPALQVIHGSLAGIAPLETRTLGQRVYNGLRDYLMAGQLQPGQKLTLRDLAAALNVSPMPVRESVRRLAAEGALEILPNYGPAAFGIGNVYRLKGYDTGALHWYEQALQREPKAIDTHVEIALLHLRYGQLDAAEAAARTGLEIDPNEPLLLVCLSAVHTAQGDSWRSRAVLARLDGIGTLDGVDAAQVADARNAIQAVMR